jgi:hypothetical protein
MRMGTKLAIWVCVVICCVSAVVASVNALSRSNHSVAQSSPTMTPEISVSVSTPSASAKRIELKPNKPKKPAEPTYISVDDFLEKLNNAGEGGWGYVPGMFSAYVFTQYSSPQYGVILIPDSEGIDTSTKDQLESVYSGSSNCVTGNYRGNWYLYWWDPNSYGDSPPMDDVNAVLGY